MNPSVLRLCSAFLLFGIALTVVLGIFAALLLP